VRAMNLLLVVFATGCATSPISDIGLFQDSVSEIEITGVKNLGDAQLRITDPDEIKEILALIRDARSTFSRAHVSFDSERVQVIRIRLFQGDKDTEYTFVGGWMSVPGDSGGGFYSPSNGADKKLWNLLLERL